MKPPHSTGRNVIAILAIPIVMLFLIVITPFSFGIASPFDLCGMIDAGSRATSLSFICRGVFYEDGIPTGIWRSKLPLLGQIDGRPPYFCLEPQAMNYLIDDQPLDSITLAYDYAPNTDERHMNQVLDKLLGQCGLIDETGQIINNDPKLMRTELRRVGKIKGRSMAAYWQAWAIRDKSEFGHSTYMVTVYTRDGIKDNVDDFASSKLGIPKTTKPANPDEIL
ncbi:MAG: hypothetical protein UFT36_09595 [Collinsella sp.]|nr:hypothetical protein [Collinsella sp.]